MNIIVCVKRVPLTQEVDLEIDQTKKGVRKDMLAYVINEWDNYAIEEAGFVFWPILWGATMLLKLGSPAP